MRAQKVDAYAPIINHLNIKRSLFNSKHNLQTDF